MNKITRNMAQGFAALVFVATLGGCDSVADSLGLGRNPPDEFAVVDRPPLALPPDFNLRPPKPGEPRPQAVSMTQRAGTILYGSDATLPNAKRDASSLASPEADVAGSDVEKQLLTAAGVDHADPNIRMIVDRESSEKITGSRHLVDDLLWWRDSTPPATTVDAPAEAQRIREAKEKGESINKGATPVIERKKSGWLGM